MVGCLVMCISPALALIGCGLPSYPALVAPSRIEFPTSPEAGLVFSFSMPAENNPDTFLGLEPYYKIYTGLEEEAANIDDENSAIDRSSLERLGFRRFLDATTAATVYDDRPLILLDTTTKTDADATILIDFSPIAGELADYPNLIIGDDSYPLARNAATDPSTAEKRGFDVDQIQTGDPDIPETYDPDSADPAATNLYIAIYLLAYGQDIDALEFNIFSQPTFGGYIAIPGY